MVIGITNSTCWHPSDGAVEHSLFHVAEVSVSSKFALICIRAWCENLCYRTVRSKNNKIRTKNRSLTYVNFS